MTSSKSAEYEISYNELDFRIEVTIYAEQDEGCWTSWDGSPGTPPSESRTFTIDSFTEINEDGQEKQWKLFKRHPYYDEVYGEVEKMVGEEEMEY